MKTLKEISIEHFNNTLNDITETERRIRIARITNNKNSLLREELRLKCLKGSLEYHKAKINEE